MSYTSTVMGNVLSGSDNSYTVFLSSSIISDIESIYPDDYYPFLAPVRVGYKDITTGGNKEITFHYDKCANRTKKTDENDNETDYVFNAMGQLTKIVFPDDDECVYDYDWMGMRNYEKKKNGDELRHYWWTPSLSGLPLIQTYVKSGAPDEVNNLVYGPELLMRDRDGTFTYFLIGDNNNVVGLANEGETVTDRYDYSAFSELLSHAGSDDNNFMFSAEPNDEDSGLVYLRKRYYASEIGKFISSDPKFAYGINRQNYCYNAPVEWVDLSGLDVKQRVLSHYTSIIWASRESKAKIPPEIIAAMLAMEMKYLGSANDLYKARKMDLAILSKDIGNISVGLSQIKVNTAIETSLFFKEKLYNEAYYLSRLQDPKTNILYAANYLSMLKIQYQLETGRRELNKGDWTRIISSYNTGFTPGLTGRNFVSDYSGSVLQYIIDFQGEF